MIVLRGQRYPFIDPLLPTTNIFSKALHHTKFNSQIQLHASSHSLSPGMCIIAGLCLYTMNHLVINYSMKLLVLLLLIFQFNITPGQVELVPIELSSGEELKPVEPTEYRLFVEANANYTRRRQLAPFQLCLVCKCCTASSTNCATMPCCFGIDCQLPNKPFGVCAFVPKTCNCNSCAV